MLPNVIPNINHRNSGNFFLIAGPCVVETPEIVNRIAEELKAITSELEIPFIFKASYRKANRTRIDSFTGIGDEKALNILKDAGDKYQVPTITDIHESDEAAFAAKFVDVLQIPAFLCRQTDLLVAAAKTGKTVNVKKGQFLSPEAMKFAIDKIRGAGNENVMLTERGTTFGYTDLVVDFRAIPAMKALGVPVIMDITHSVQQPNQTSGVTGGKPELIKTIARAAIASGADGIFLETHPEPSKALSDGANMIRLDEVKKLLQDLLRIRAAVRD